MQKPSLFINNRLVLEKNVLLAPLAGITDFPFRRTARMCGAELVFTEMISSNGLAFKNQKTLSMVSTLKDEQPVGVQIFGSNPEIMAEAAIICQELGATLIDINMGCPQKKIVKTGAGAALMLDPALAQEIVGQVARKVSVPVTCKIRLGWDNQNINAPSFAKMMEDAGASMITVHGRTRSQMFAGKADWEAIARVKKTVSIPVVANGDIFSPQDAKRCLHITRADGIMVGRAAMGRPWIIGVISDHIDTGGKQNIPNVRERLRIILFHLDAIREFYEQGVALKIARKHLAWYTKGMRNSAAFRDALFRTKNLDELERLTCSFFKRMLRERADISS